MNAVAKSMLVSNALVKRTPLPVVYEEACRQLAEVATVMDAKYFADKAEALAVWAKIYRSDQAALEAKRLKLHAFRKMGLIAEQLRPTSASTRCKTGGGASLLKENGLNSGHAAQAIRLSRIPENKFNSAINQNRPPPIVALSRTGVGRGAIRGRSMSSECYLKLNPILGGVGLTHCANFVRKNQNPDVSGFTESEVEKALVATRECLDWFDEFDRKLQHRKSQLSKAKISKVKP